jgi:hypothetical protein
LDRNHQPSKALRANNLALTNAGQSSILFAGRRILHAVQGSGMSIVPFIQRLLVYMWLSGFSAAVSAADPAAKAGSCESEAGFGDKALLITVKGGSGCAVQHVQTRHLAGRAFLVGEVFDLSGQGSFVGRPIWVAVEEVVQVVEYDSAEQAREAYQKTVAAAPPTSGVIPAAHESVEADAPAETTEDPDAARLGPCALPSDVSPINRRDFAIPIVVDASRRADIKQLILYVSTDEGKDWKQIAVASSDQASFRFTAPKDGLYWFSVAVVDARGRQQPLSPYQAPPAQKVLVDTKKPVVKIVSAERLGSEIAVAWKVDEANADLASLKLEYQPVDRPSSTWRAAPIEERALCGSTRFKVATSGAVIVRLAIKDLADNAGAAQKTVSVGSIPVTAR